MQRLVHLQTETNVLPERLMRNDSLDAWFDGGVDDSTDLTEHLRVAVDLRHDGEVRRELLDQYSRHPSTIELLRALQACKSVHTISNTSVPPPRSAHIHRRTS